MHRAAGDFLERRAATSPDLRDDLDAGHYLLQAGEPDRAFDLVGAASQLLQGRGRVGDSLAVLQPFFAGEAMARLGDQNRGRLHGIGGQAHVTLGDGPAALRAFQTASGIFERLAAQDPANAAWQHDLAISHDRWGTYSSPRGTWRGPWGPTGRPWP